MIPRASLYVAMLLTISSTEIPTRAAPPPARFRTLARLEGASAGDKFGCYVARADDWDGYGTADLVVGAPGWANDRGRVYVVSGEYMTDDDIQSSRSVNEVLIALMSGEATGDKFGDGLAYLRDVTGDGRGEVIVGAPHAGANEEGKIYVFAGGTSYVSLSVVAGTVSGAELGEEVDDAGDVNGDGAVDVIAGAPGADLAYVYFADPSSGTFSSVNSRVLTVPSAATLGHPVYDSRFGSSTNFGRAVAGVGDVDGDGYDDYAVGAPLAYSPSSPNSTTSRGGAVYVFSGQTGSYLWSSYGEVRPDGSSTGAEPLFGYAVSSAGDWDQDGTDDVLVGAYYTYNIVGGSHSGTGKVYVHSGSDGAKIFGWQPSHHPPYANTYAYTGYSVAGGVDFGFDGKPDLLAGATTWAFGLEFLDLSRGRVFALEGGDITTATTARVILDEIGESAADRCPQEGDMYGIGYDVNNIGDVNGDGRPDIAVASPWIDIDGSNRGQVQVLVSYLLGDVNEDGGVDTGDIVYLNQYVYSQGSAPSPLDSGDVDHDGDVDEDDYSCLANYVLYGGVSLPCNCTLTSASKYDFDCSDPLPSMPVPTEEPDVQCP